MSERSERIVDTVRSAHGCATRRQGANVHKALVHP